MPKVKVTTTEKLEQEIARLKKRSRRLEGELGDRIDFFKGNYKKMALNSVIPGSAKHSGIFSIAGRVAKVAWESGTFKSFATSAIMTALEFAGVRLGINLFDKFRKTRSKKKKAKAAESEED
ncbi:hypothetical protein SAMN05518672_10975 [Chitinophaga sp. CF118]|uniref:hypothetical protein n=1 Tax=Chitinophaga sp. CF118 TaxID=1884367 RepID=UPI0008DF36CF|nr:hypothetical protein [Chitinophaga sp. CF118]SFE68847.1 hypothetical protein SAMN05518672_10975 [Chitinophaga sp. CF118]